MLLRKSYCIIVLSKLVKKGNYLLHRDRKANAFINRCFFDFDSEKKNIFL
jgi:hypothetical protein